MSKEVYEINKEEIGKRLEALRGNKTQVEVANANGISVSALSMYERGERIPRDEIKVRLSNYYDVSIEFIFYMNSSHVS